MGCDIHLYKEKNVNGKWVTADEWTPNEYYNAEDPDGERPLEVEWEKRFTDRNYQLFGLLSDNVRESHAFSFKERGLPFDVSTEIKSESDGWDSDGHSHSYLYLHELKAMHEYLGEVKINVTGMKDKDQIAELQKTIDAGNPDWDLLFPYCQSANIPSYIDFSFDVPANFYMGQSLKKIIDSFDGIDGDNHRIVFWFDN